MREGVDQPDQRFLTVIEKVMASWVGTNFCSSYKASTLFRIYKRCFQCTGSVVTVRLSVL